MGMEERGSGRDDLVTNVALLTQAVYDDKEMTKKVHDRLFGNGQEGLIATVATVKQTADNNKKSIGTIWKAAIGIITSGTLAAAIMRVIK